MSQNPYSTALFSIGGIALFAAIVMFIMGRQADLDGLGAVAFAGMLFPVAGFALVAWLLLEGIQWSQRAQVAARD